MNFKDPDLVRILTHQRKEFEKFMVQQRVEFERHVGVIAEDFKSQVQLLAEQVSGHDGKFQSIEEKLSNLGEMVAKNTEDIEMIKDDLVGVKSDLKQKPDRTEFVGLKKRVSALE